MKIPYSAMDRLLVRAPFYSYTEYDLLRLPEILERQTFRNAIWLASPVFYGLLEKKHFDFKQLNDREQHTLTKYYNRMCFRPTPFGSFSTISEARWGKSERIYLGTDEDCRIALLPDQRIIAALDRRMREAGGAARLRLNPVMYPIGREYRFLRSSVDIEGFFTFSLERIEKLPFYTALTDIFQKKTMDRESLSLWISRESGCEEAEARDYVEFLISAQILTDQYRGSLISGPTGRYTDLNMELPAAADLPARAREWLSNLPVTDPEPGRSCFYAAALRPSLQGQLDPSLRAELEQAVSVLSKLTLPRDQSALSDFTRDFSRRFEQQKVPLLLALDPDAGLNYAGLSPVAGVARPLDGIPFRQDPLPSSLEWEALRRLFFRLWPTRGSFAPLLISDAELGSLPEATVSRPPTLPVLFRYTEEHLLIEYAGGASACTLAGRFSEFSEEACLLSREIAEKEQESHPDVLFADIGQLSDTHADNINRRRQIYPYEIPVNVYPASAPEKLLEPADLLLSVSQGHLILESLSHGKRVIPRLSTAFNFRRNGLGIFRLLCDLQYQGTGEIRALDLEQLFPGLPFYPRVVYERTILSLAKWKFSAAELAPLRGNSGTESAKLLRAFRRQYGLPQKVSMGPGDQQLVFDLADPQEAAFFTACFSGRDETLYEYLLPDRSVRAGRLPLAGQFMAALAHPEKVYQGLSRPAGPPAVRTRQFLPGSEWLYLKLFCTPRSADLILAEVIAPLRQRYGSAIRQWFFIRYEENGHHLRLRFLVNHGANGRLLNALKKALQRAGHEALIRDLQAGTYQRELERYGEELIEAAEHIFYTGSELVLSHLSSPVHEQGALRLALRTTRAMIAACCPDENAAIVFTARVSENFLLEYGGDKAMRTALDQKYRSMRSAIENWLSAPAQDLEQYCALVREICARAGARGESLLADLVHMQLNRTFSAEARRQEMLVYYLLHKHLVSLRARGKNV